MAKYFDTFESLANAPTWSIGFCFRAEGLVCLDCVLYWMTGSILSTEAAYFTRQMHSPIVYVLIMQPSVACVAPEILCHLWDVLFHLGLLCLQYIFLHSCWVFKSHCFEMFDERDQRLCVFDFQIEAGASCSIHRVSLKSFYKFTIELQRRLVWYFNQT